MKRRIIELRSFQLTGMLMAMFWLSTFYAFAQSQDNEPRVKKKIVITQIDENGNIQTETEEIEIPDVDKLLNDDHLFNLGAPGFNKGIKKVVVLDANEEIPQEIRKEITNMGLNVTNVKNQLKSAEQGIIIKKSIGQPATIEDYTDLISPGIGMYTFPKHDLMDIDIDIENHGNGIIHLNRDGQQETFKFDGKNIPEDIQKKLDELGIDLQHLDHGNNSWMDKNNGKLDLNGQNFEFHSDDGKQKRRMMIITDENEMSDEIKGLLEEQDINLEELKSKARSYSQSHRNKFECNEKAEMPVLGVMVSDNEKKVTIDKVVENSAASEAGLKAGDIITEINGTSMESKYEVVRLIKAKKPGNELTIKYLRNGKNKKTKAILKAKKINKPNWNSRQFESLGKAGCDDVRKFPLNENRSNGVPPQWNRQFEFGGHGLGRSRWNMSQDCETLCLVS